MKTDFMVIARVRNSENINKLVKAIEDKGCSCYNFLSKATVPEYAHLTRVEQMEILNLIKTFGTIHYTSTTMRQTWTVLKMLTLS